MTTPVKINQYMASVSQFTKKGLLSLSCQPLLPTLYPLHSIAFNFIDSLADKRQLSAQIYMWELLT